MQAPLHSDVIVPHIASFASEELKKKYLSRCVSGEMIISYCEEYPIARAWRDTRVLSIFAGTNEIMKTIAAKFMGL